MSQPQELRQLLEAEWQAAETEADNSRNPFAPLDRLVGIYRRLDSDEKGQMQHVVCDWILSSDPKKRYDAINLASQLRMQEAIPNLRKLLKEAEQRSDHEAPYEWSMLNRVIAHILEGETE